MWLLLGVLMLQMAWAGTAVYSGIDDTSFASPRYTARGMSGAALLDEPDAVMHNPATIATQKPTLFFSSYTLLEDIKNTRGGFSIPLGSLGIAFAYQGARISDIDVFPEVSAKTLDINGRPYANYLEQANFDQSIIYCGLGGLLWQGDGGVKRLSLGLAFKSMMAKSSGASNIDEMNGMGYNLDVGLQSQLNQTWAVGLTAHNVLVNKNGAGGFVWQNGTQEDIPAVLRIGNAFSSEDNNLRLLLDADIFQKGYKPNLMYGGAEIKLTQYFTMRGGIRQYAFPTSTGYIVYNALTGGLSISPMTGLNLDYAYYPSDGYGLNALHYVGLSFDSFDVFVPTGTPTVAPPKQKLAPEPGKIIIRSPQEFVRTSSSSITVTYATTGLTSITINGQNMPIQEKYTAALQDWRNELVFETKDQRLLRTVFKNPTCSDPKSQYAALSVVLSDQFSRDFSGSNDVLTLGEWSSYVAQSLRLTMPNEFKDTFSTTDLLYLNGYFGQGESIAPATDVALSRGEAALMLARIEGYEYALQGLDPDTAQRKAIQILIETGFYAAEEFEPLTEAVTRREAIALIARLSDAQTSLNEQCGSMPIIWSTYTIQKNQPRAVVLIYLANAERFATLSVAVGGQKQDVPGFQSGVQFIQIPIELSTVSDNPVVVNAVDRYDNRYVARWLIPQALPPIAVQELIMVKTNPKEAYPGQKIKVDVGIPGELDLDMVSVSGNVLDTPLLLNKEEDNVWSGVISIPEYCDTDCTFIVSGRSGAQVFSRTFTIPIKTLTKKIPVATPKLKRSVRTPDAAAPLRIMTKTVPTEANAGGTISIYVGVLPADAAVTNVSVVIDSGETLKPSIVNTMLWKTVYVIPKNMKPGRHTYKVYVKNAKTEATVHVGGFRIFSKTVAQKGAPAPKKATPQKTPAATVPKKTAVQTVAKKTVVPVKKPIKLNQPEINRPYYPVGIVITPANGLLQAKISDASPKIKKVTMEINNKQKISLQKNNGTWSGKQTILKAWQGKEIQIKIYTADVKGNVSMTEKFVKVP
jgi:hypothetical protein